MSTIVITGGTGMIGSHLSDFLVKKGYRVIILTRNAAATGNGQIERAGWDPDAGTIDESIITAADHIVHLAGAGVADQRWSGARKREIQESRTRGASLLAKTLERVPNKVQSVVSASAIGWYGPDTPQSRKIGFTEDAAANGQFLGETCRLWEESIAPVEKSGIRLVRLRIGIVLSETGGALAEFAKPLRFGIATIAGDGEQVVSWIHVDDLCRIILYAIENKEMNGVFNAVAPNPVTNKELVLTLAQQKRGRVFIPVHVPAFVLKLALGEMSIEVLKSATVSSEKLRQQGFVFQYPTLKAALHLK